MNLKTTHSSLRVIEMSRIIQERSRHSMSSRFLARSSHSSKTEKLCLLAGWITKKTELKGRTVAVRLEKPLLDPKREAVGKCERPLLTKEGAERPVSVEALRSTLI